MKRQAWIDNLRVMVIILVIILHTAVTYSGLGGWYYSEGGEVDLISMIFFAFFQTFTQAYFMSLLFMVSGYFSKMSFDKKGSGRFLTGRFKRLGIPLAIYVFIIHPLTVKMVYPDMDLAEWYVNGLKNLHFFSWTGPMWFVEALLIFSLIYVLIHKLGLRKSFKVHLNINIINVTILVLIIGLVAFLIRLVYPMGSDFYNLQFSFFSAYVFMFALGILAFTGGSFERISLKDGKKWLFISLGIGIPAWLLITLLGGATEDESVIFGGMNWPSLFYALWESFFCVTFIIALVGLFKHRMNISGKFQKFLSDQAFGVYVFHAPVLVGISMIVKDVHLHPILKFFLVFPIAVALSFFVSWALRRIKPLRRIFF